MMVGGIHFALTLLKSVIVVLTLLLFDLSGSPQYFNIIEKLPDLTSVRHELTKTHYAYKDDGGVVSYDGKCSQVVFMLSL